MSIREFIFSEKKSDRIKRHLLFWFCIWLFNAFVPGGWPGRSYFSNIPHATLGSFQDLVPQIFFAYVLIAFVLPGFLKGRYILSFLLLIFFVFTAGVFNFICMNYIFPPPPLFPPTGNIWVDFVNASKGTLVAATAICSFKLLKYWHLKEKRNLELLKEKTEAQLQLLTAQVHPNFLFNTLNNINSKAQNESPGSAKMIMELSHILRYILDEGKHELVPLENELQMLKGYIHLEKMRYDDKLDLHLLLPSKTENVYITPLLLLPFVENCFKHGTSKVLKNPWINLKIELQGTLLVMKLMNGKKTSPVAQNFRKGTGIENVRKRLELLYKGRYDLQINEDEEVFIVNLKLELVEVKSAKPVHLSLNPKTEYA
jgi:sensor histidine kinase YesM